MFKSEWLLKPVSSALGRVSQEDPGDLVMGPCLKMKLTFFELNLYILYFINMCSEKCMKFLEL
jgi:hypothetical protein